MIGKLERYIFDIYSLIELKTKVIEEFWKETTNEVRQGVFLKLISTLNPDKKDKTEQEAKLDSQISLPSKSTNYQNNIPLYSQHSLETCSTFIGWIVNTNCIKNESNIISKAKNSENSTNHFILFLDYLDFITQKDFMVLISKGSNLEKVDEFIHFLSFSNFERCNMSIDNLCRKLLQIIDETQRELTLNELLASEESANLALKTKFEDFNSIPPKSHKKHRKSNSSYQIKPQNNDKMAVNINKKGQAGYFQSDWMVKAKFLDESIKNKKKKMRNKKKKEKTCVKTKEEHVELQQDLSIKHQEVISLDKFDMNPIVPKEEVNII